MNQTPDTRVSSPCVDLSLFTAETLNKTNSSNYVETLGRVFPGGELKTLANGMRVLVIGGPRKILYFPGFQASILASVQVVAGLSNRLPPEYGVVLLDYPGIGINEHVLPDTPGGMTDKLLATVFLIMSVFKVEVLVPVSLGNRFVFSHGQEILQRQPDLSIASIVPVVLDSPMDALGKFYFKCYLGLHRWTGLKVYRLMNANRIGREIWFKITCAHSTHPLARPLEYLNKRLTRSAATPGHYLEIMAGQPTPFILTEQSRTAFLLAEKDSIADAKAHEQWALDGGVPQSSIHWTPVNHQVEVEDPQAVVRVISSLLM